MTSPKSHQKTRTRAQNKKIIGKNKILAKAHIPYLRIFETDLKQPQLGITKQFISNG